MKKKPTGKLKLVSFSVELTGAELVALYELIDSTGGDCVPVAEARKMPAMSDGDYHAALQDALNSIGKALDKSGLLSPPVTRENQNSIFPLHGRPVDPFQQ